MNSIAIVGTGAIGGFYGALLARAGYDVHFLLNSDYEYVKQNGLRIESPDGNFTIPSVNTWNSSSNMPKCDLVIITLKTTVNFLLKDILPQLCHRNSKVLVLQNGLDTDKDAAGTVPMNEVFGGVCSVACNKSGPGYIKHIAYKQIHMGQYTSGNNITGITNSLKAISDILNNAGIPTILDKSITEARWRKLVWNMAFNGLSTVLNCDTKVIMENPQYRKRAILIMDEVIKAANSCGMNIEAGYTDKMVELTDNMAPYLPSMKLDYDNGRPLEFEVIYQRPIQQARINKCKIPNIEQLAEELVELAVEKEKQENRRTYTSEKNTSAETGESPSALQ